MAYYIPTTETELIVDASAEGLGAILIQKTCLDGGSEVTNIVGYAIRALNNLEKRYSQSEKEGLVIVCFSLVV